MSSSQLGDFREEQAEDNDDPMQGARQEEEEGNGDEMAANITDDSSEEGEDDEEEARRVREGFIVDEDEEEEDEEEERRRRRKKRKKHHRRRDQDEELEEDDLDLLAENTGGTFRRNQLTRLRRGRVSESPPAAATKRKNVVESSDEELDNDNLPQVQDIQKIWDDERGRDDEEDDGDMDLSDFIDYDEEGGGAMDEASRLERRREQQELQKRKRAFGSRPELAGMDANAWDEIHDVFGDGHDYDWALVGEEDNEPEEERPKQDTKYHDVFEPSEIRQKMLTDDDDLIRVQDIPERMQLATSSLSSNTTLSTHPPMTEADLDGAAMWVTQRISARKNREYFSADGQFQHLRGALVMAVTSALRYLIVEEFEVPHIWAHKRDYLCHFDVNDIRTRKELLSLNELWRIYTLGQKYRSLLERKRALSTLYERLQVNDEYFEGEIIPHVDSAELVADATEWLHLKYKEKKGDAVESRAHEEEPDVKKPKMPSRISAYEVAKRSIVSKLAESFGLESRQIIMNFLASDRVHFVQDQDLNPGIYAEQFGDPDPSKALTAEELLRRARLILSTELGKDPLLRDHVRKLFREEAQVTVEPTERGIVKIDQNHPYYNFKYLLRKPIRDMLESAQFLHILAAERDHLVTVSIFLPHEQRAELEQRLNNAFSSDNFSDATRSWNIERTRVVQEVVERHLIPIGAKWVREYLREEVEDFLAQSCAVKLRKRINVAPYIIPGMKPGDTSSILALTWGRGDPQKDAVSIVFLDEAGRMREHTKVDNLFDGDNLDEFIDLLKRRKPDVIVIGGLSMTTLRLSQRVREVLSGKHSQSTSGEPSRGPQEQFQIPVVYVHDDVARIYQHSNRAAEELGTFSSNIKYCVGLARYAQSPLNEFAALGRDITAITFEEDDQHLVPVEKLLTVFERVLVDVTNKVGVDINRAITDGYYQHLLPFVCGLGPRKAQALVKKIGALGGTLVNRDQFIKGSLLTTKIFLNASAFLRIAREDNDMRHFKNRRDDDDAPDPLDDTRIHPEDYELARKMATDALELDEEDIHDEHPSHVVTLIMNDPDNEKKLMELNLDEFAISLYQANYDQKRHTLNVIRDELLKPYAEQRDPFLLPQDMEIITMLSGETERTLRHGLMVSAVVYRTTRTTAFVRLDSGVEGIISSQRLSDNNAPVDAVVRKGQTITGIIIHKLLQLDQDQFNVELSCQRQLLEERDDEIRKVRVDMYYDTGREAKDKEMLSRKKRAESDRSRRVIKHPNFHNFNAAQAETFLEKQQRGDVIIRPSSKGIDHLAVTWKVEDKLYQHIDVTDSSADLTGQTTGQLIVDPGHTYADLDELIVNHIQAMARRVEELMAHEKFKQGPEDELHLFLKNSLAANPAKSMYGFTLNRKRPGHFNLCFLANKNSTVQTWPVRVTPEAYYLFDAAAVGVPELCDAFKVRHLHESQNVVNATGGKTPFAGGRTPARPGGATPGHASIRHVGRTPNPYSGSQTPYGGGPPPMPPYGGSQTYGYQTPSSSHHPAGYPQSPASIPTSMNPARAQMLQQTSGPGWGQNPGWS